MAYNGAGGFRGDVNNTCGLSHNCVYGNTGTDYSGIAIGSGDISSNPVFHDRTNGDYRITTSSPCKNAAGESRMGPVIHARPAEVEFGGVTIDYPQPDDTAVPGVPTLSWHPSWTQSAELSYYQCQIDRFVGENDWQLAWLVLTPSQSVVYGQQSNVRTFFAATGPLVDFAEYVCSVFAVDSENWAFAVAPEVHFATAGL